MARPPRRIADTGEFGLIRAIERIAGRTPGRDVRIGIGDDAAVLRLRPGEDVVLTTDALVENVHFRLDQETPRTAGRRALVANLSDLAAMGARPLGFTCAFGAPPELPLRVALGLVRGLVEEARRHGCPLVGGNVARGRDVSLAIAALGAVPRDAALRRDGARPGDRLLVTGALGAQALARARGRVRQVPEPRLRAGQRLRRGGWATACIDLSDGLLPDLRHVCEASGVGAELDGRRVPRARGLAAGARRLGLDPDRLALAGGEDYELLFAVRPGAPSATALARRLGLPVAEVGRVVRRGLHLRHVAPALARDTGFRHF